MTPPPFRDPASPRLGLDGIDGPCAKSPGAVLWIDRGRAWQPLRLVALEARDASKGPALGNDAHERRGTERRSDVSLDSMGKGDGGGGGNRTRVRWRSAVGSTCLAASFDLTVRPPTGRVATGEPAEL